METTYSNRRFATKKALKEAVTAGEEVGVHCEGLGPSTVPDGTHVVVGPGPYERKWYGNVVVVDGYVKKVK
jgi:hypothetical protein